MKVSRVKSNGRRDIQELQRMVDKFIVRYIPGTAVRTNEKTGEVYTVPTMKTIAALVIGNQVHVGVAKWSNRGLEYNKTRGRARACGRAEIAFNIAKGLEKPRKSHFNPEENRSLCYTIELAEPTNKNVINAIMGIETLNEELEESSQD